MEIKPESTDSLSSLSTTPTVGITNPTKKMINHRKGEASKDFSVDDADDNDTDEESLQQQLLLQVQSNGGETLLHLEDNPKHSNERTIDLYRRLASKLQLTILPQTDEGWCLFRQTPTSIEDIPEVRVAVCGNVDAGKSTLLGVLTSGILDDGRGRARIGLFRHKHEIESGRTSSIGQEVLAFDQAGQVIVANNGRTRVGRDEICPNAHKVITFMDLAGHERYLKTTMFGLTGGAPDYVMLIVGANGGGLIGMAKEHLALAFALGLPVIVVVTKTDMCPENVKEATLRHLQRLLRSPTARRTPISIRGAEDVVLAISNFYHNMQLYHQQQTSNQRSNTTTTATATATAINSNNGVSHQGQNLCPVFQVSSVTGEGLNLLRQLLHLLPPGRRYGGVDEPAEFHITDTYLVPGVGTVVAGVVISGSINLGQTLYLGPDSTGSYTACQVKGVQRKRINVHRVFAGQCASFALKKIKRAAVRKGMVLLGRERVQAPPPDGRACREFEAEVVILFHSTTIGPRYQAMLHCGVVRQTVAIVALNLPAPGVLRTGDRAVVRFRFMWHPEYLRVGTRLVFREGHTKGVGRIINLL